MRSTFIPCILALTLLQACGSTESIDFPDVPKIMTSEQEGVAGTTCTLPTLSADVASPATSGDEVTFTASSTCTGDAAEYLFAVRLPGQVYVAVTSYSNDPTWTFDTTGLAPGEYGVLVFVRGRSQDHSQAGWNATYYSIITAGQSTCTIESFTADPVSPIALGSVVTLTATATCTNDGTPEFAYARRFGGGPATIVYPHNTDAEFEWDTEGLEAGTYSWIAFVRAVGNSGAADGGINVGWKGRSLVLEDPELACRSEGVNVGGFCWYLGANGQSCDAVCATHQMSCDIAGTRDYAGSAGTNENCTSVLTALGVVPTPFFPGAAGYGGGCTYNSIISVAIRWGSPATTCAASDSVNAPACACQ